MLAVTILGNNSAVPAFDRHPTAQVVQTEDQSFLVDCGEGTQLQMMNYKIRRGKINHIFISHLHGDHYFGLIGMITSMGLMSRTQELHLHGPAPLEEIIQLQLNCANTHLPFPLHFHALGEEGILVDEKKVSVECFHVKHRIPCWGFIFREKKNPRKIEIEKVKEYKVPPVFYERLHLGEDYIREDGTVIENQHLTIPTTPPKSYAYCADTIYDESIAEKIKHVDLVYHEATYLHELHERAAARFHSTSKQAAMIAQLACAKRLIIGHFSSMYESLDDLIIEASAEFENTELAMEGTCYRV